MNTTLSTLWQRIKPATQFDVELNETPSSIEADESRRAAIILRWAVVFFLIVFIYIVRYIYQTLILKIPATTTSHSMVIHIFCDIAFFLAIRAAYSKKIVPSIYWLGFGFFLEDMNMVFRPDTYYQVVAPMVFYINLLFITLFLPRREVARAMFFNIGYWFVVIATAFFGRFAFVQLFGKSAPIDPFLSVTNFVIPISLSLLILYQFRRISVLSKLMGTLSLLTLALYVVVSSSAQSYALQTVQTNADSSLSALAQAQASGVDDWHTSQVETLQSLSGNLDTSNLNQYTGLFGDGAELSLLDNNILKGKQNTIDIVDGRILIAVPASGQALAVTYPASTLNSLLSQGKLGETGEMDIYIPEQSVLIRSSGIESLSATEMDELEGLIDSEGGEVSYQGESVLAQSAAIAETNWIGIAHQHISEINAPAIEQGRQVEFLLAMAVGLLWLALVWFSQVVARPINQLRDVALQVRAGDLGARAKVEGTDEIGLLTGSFNRMTRQLRETLQGLEDRISARTRDLQISSEVSRDITQILKLEELLPRLVEKTQTSFGMYFVSVFLYDLESKQLILAAGTGEVGARMKSQGREFSIDDRPSIVAQAARERQAVVVNDVSLSPAYFANPLLPETRSETALPMLVGDRLVGVLGLQSTELNHFGAAELNILNLLAGQIAVAVRNAQLYQEQLSVSEQLRTVDKLKSQFLSSMTHELRTPLNAIINFVEMVAMGMVGTVTDEQKDLLDRSTESSKHLLHLINDVLDISKIEAGQLQLFIEKDVNVETEIKEAVAALTPGLLDKPLKIVEDIDGDLPLISGDKRRIRQILSNLLSNAIKFTDEGTITLSAKKQKNEIICAVIDTGQGISKEAQEVIFEPFMQTLDGVKQAEGSGLGLPIVKSLVEAHGGKVWLESRLGEGTDFYFSLPVEVK